MALVVEDGTVVANADSYITLAFADNYFSVDVEFNPTWDGLNESDKEQLIKWSTRVLDQKVRWKGTKTDPASSLRWPRTGVSDRDGETINSDQMPLQLKEITCEMAKYLLSNDPTVGQGIDYLKRIAVDVVEIEYQDGATQPSAPPIFNQLLRGIGHYPMPMGHSFGRILKA